MLSSNESIRVRIRLAALMLVLFFICLAWKLYSVQVLRHDYLYQRAKEKYTTTKSRTAKRGEICDINGNLLVTNIPCMDIAVDPSLMKEEQLPKIAAMFAGRLKMDRDELLKKISRKERTRSDGTKVAVKYVSVARNVDFLVGDELQQTAAANKFKGMDFRYTYKREYPKSELLSNVLGFTSMDHDKVIAVMGVEKFYNREMQSIPGREKYERFRDGRPMPFGTRSETPAKNGLNIYLTIDEPVQAILEEELDKLYEEWKPSAAYAVMADPKTGNIIAMAQRPSFNPNDRSSLEASAYRIRIIEDSFEPGSIMKPLSISGAIDRGLVRPETMIDCENGRWAEARMTDSHKIGVVDVREIIKQSSNIGSAKIGVMMGEQALYDTLSSFGLGQPTGLPLKPETTGRLRKIKQWDGMSISRFPIGYGVSVSPVQMVRAYCALANDGYLPKLRLVDRVEDPDTGQIIENPIEPPIQLFKNPQTARTMADMMAGVTETGGTGTRAAIPGFRVAGKSGTSRKVVNGSYAAGKYYASFIGFVPAENPRFVLLVTTDEPHGWSYYGGTVSGPAFRAIAERTLKYFDVKPTVPIPEKTH